MAAAHLTPTTTDKTAAAAHHHHHLSDTAAADAGTNKAARTQVLPRSPTTYAARNLAQEAAAAAAATARSPAQRSAPTGSGGFFSCFACPALFTGVFFLLFFPGRGFKKNLARHLWIGLLGARHGLRNKDDCCNYEQILQLYPDGRRKKKKMTVATGVEIMWISNADERVH